MKRIKRVGRACGAVALFAGFLGCAEVSLLDETGSADLASTTKATVETTFSDSFDSLDSDLYTTVSGTWETEDGELQETSGGVAILILDDIDADGDSTISVDVKSQLESKDAGLLVRYQDEDNYYTLALDDGKLKFKEKVSGSWSTLESETCDYSTDSFSAIAVSVEDSTFTAYFEGEEQFSVSDSSLTSGSFGLKTSGNPAYYDDLEVTYYTDGEEEDTTAPDDVSDLTADAGDGEVDLSWTNPSDSDFSYVSISYDDSTTTTSGSSATITGLTNGTSYTFTLIAYDESGNGSDGVSLTATP
ncbi:MAG: DUF4959 domain-containing protein, partial [Spirochaetales bacterium]|nr:DUF4959 domain-containing protein [Spirochaetales bacterium]